MKSNQSTKTKTIISIGMVLTLTIIGNIFLTFNLRINNNNIEKHNLKISAVSEKININSSSDWVELKNSGKCTGEGTLSNPYLIENLIIDAGSGSCIQITNSDVYFRIENCTLSTSGYANLDAGIELISVTNGQLINNNFKVCYAYGIILESSEKNTISNNLIKNERGMFLRHSNKNRICLNTFITGIFGLFTVENTSSNNFYSTDDKITYSYKGKTFKNYLGNYWNGYRGNDNNNDGIGDSAIQYYDTNEFTMDSYPLMEPVENYKLNVSGEAIPGYNIFFLFSLIFLISLIITTRAKTFKKY